jgi:hypothetical protein
MGQLADDEGALDHFKRLVERINIRRPLLDWAAAGSGYVDGPLHIST